MHRAAGHDQVAHAGQARKRLLLSAQRHTEACDLGQATGHEGRLGVVSQPQAVRNTRAERDDVLERTAQLAADNIGRRVNAEIPVVHKRLLRQLGRLAALGCGDDRRRHAARDLLRMGRAGQRNNRVFAAHCTRNGFREAAVAVFRVQSLADIDDHRSCGYDRCKLLRRRGDRERRHRHHDQIRLRCPGHIGRDPDPLGDLHTRKQFFIGALAQEQVALLLQVGPRAHLMTILVQQHGQRNAPAAGAQHKNIHFVFSSPSGADCSIVFLLLKENLFSCPRSIRMMLERCMKTTAAAMPNAIAVKTGSR